MTLKYIEYLCEKPCFQQSSDFTTGSQNTSTQALPRLVRSLLGACQSFSSSIATLHVTASLFHSMISHLNKS